MIQSSSVYLSSTHQSAKMKTLTKQRNKNNSPSWTSADPIASTTTHAQPPAQARAWLAHPQIEHSSHKTAAVQSATQRWQGSMTAD
jgi:hypothetical protein